MKKSATVLFSTALLSAVLLSTTPHTSVYAASPIQMIVNDRLPDDELQPIIKNNITYIPIRAIEEIEGLHIQSWNNNTKILTVMNTDDQTSLTFQVDQTTATRNKEKLTMKQPVILSNNRVLVPLRFMAEALNCDVAWNNNTRNLYIAKSASAQKQKLQSTNLTEARLAALNLPRLSSLTELEPTDSTMGSFWLYFPEKKSDRFFTQENGLINYYQVTDNSAQLQWQAVVSSTATKNAPFYLKGITKEIGKRPAISTAVVYYYIMSHAGQAEYGKIDQNGITTKYGEAEMDNLNELFPIQQEQ